MTAPQTMHPHGGSVQAGAVYILADPDLWADGTAWHTANLLSRLPAETTWLSALDEYGVRSLTYAGGQPSAATDWAGKLAEVAALGAENRLVIVLTRTALSGYGSEYCAWHSIDANGHAYAYCPFPTAPDTGCLGGYSALDAYAICLTHEVAEWLTDWRPGAGWTAADGEEVGDVSPCLWKGQRVSFADGTSYMVTGPWLNSIGGCWTA
jgi:hypothetical protein